MCRAYLSPYINENGDEIYTGRSNIGAVSLNLPKIALEVSKEYFDNHYTIVDNNIEKDFFKLISKYADMVFDIHEDTYKKVSKQKGSSNPLYFCEGGAWTKVGYNEPVGKIYEASTASLGYIGIVETVTALGYDFYSKEGHDFAIQIVKYLKKLTEDAKIKYNHLYALYSTPAESLCYRFQKINQADYGIIKDVTDKEYMTNSFHVPVWRNITIPEKILFEADFHSIATGGRISYTEFKYGVDKAVLEQAINFAMEKGMYYGVNIVSSFCNDCHHKGDFHSSCPKCDSVNVTVVTRVCGYLSFETINGDTRYNPGKVAEVKDRVKHSIKEEVLLYG